MAFELGLACLTADVRALARLRSTDDLAGDRIAFARVLGLHLTRGRPVS
jgi:hypothetical protein